MIPASLSPHGYLALALCAFVDCDAGPDAAASELAANASCVLTLEPDLDPALVLADMIRHRMKVPATYRGFRCGDVAMAASCGARAWRRMFPVQEGAAA